MKKIAAVLIYSALSVLFIGGSNAYALCKVSASCVGTTPGSFCQDSDGRKLKCSCGTAYGKTTCIWTRY